MGKRLGYLFCIILVYFFFASIGIADDPKDDAPLVLRTEFVYHAGNKDSQEKSRALAAFGARKKAVDAAAHHFVQRGLLKKYGPQQEEIFCLAAGEIKARVIRESYEEKEKKYFIEIKAEVGIADFMEAEIVNQAMERQEADFPWKEEMEQDVSESIDPGRELSRAYRYIRKDQTRIAIIYLDHLAKKYENWGDVFYVRSIGFRRMHNPDQMLTDLEKACSLDYQAACQQLEASR